MESTANTYRDHYTREYRPPIDEDETSLYMTHVKTIDVYFRKDGKTSLKFYGIQNWMDADSGKQCFNDHGFEHLGTYEVIYSDESTNTYHFQCTYTVNTYNLNGTVYSDEIEKYQSVIKVSGPNAKDFCLENQNIDEYFWTLN